MEEKKQVIRKHELCNIIAENQRKDPSEVQEIVNEFLSLISKCCIEDDMKVDLVKFGSFYKRVTAKRYFVFPKDDRSGVSGGATKIVFSSRVYG